MARIHRNQARLAPKAAARTSAEPKKTAKVTGQTAKGAGASRAAGANKRSPSPGEAEARAAVAAVYARVDAWNSGATFTEAPRTLPSTTGPRLGEAELAALANTEALWLIR